METGAEIGIERSLSEGQTRAEIAVIGATPRSAARTIATDVASA
jgi:hypothetical protein